MKISKAFSLLSHLLLAVAISRALTMPKKPSVAVIGGGIAGLSCASRLADRFEVTVFDTGRLRPGGRCSSRLAGDASKPDDEREYPLLSRHLYDHAAQILTLPSGKDMFADFVAQVQDWESRGVIRRFPRDTVYHIHSAENIVPLPESNLYYGFNGMASLALDLVKGCRFTVQQDVWVSPSNGVKWQNDSRQWRVQAKGQVLGHYDKLVIAHNGKCADRLMSKTPAKVLHNLLRVNFAPKVPAHGGKRMTLNSIYSLTVCLPSDNNVLSQVLPDTFISGFVHNHKALKFLSCQSRKYSTNSEDDERVVWTILSSAGFAKNHKAPQEFLSDETIQELSSLLLQGVEEALGLATTSLQNAVLERLLQLWGAALPLNVWDGRGDSTEMDSSSSQSDNKRPLGFIYDSDYSVGVCGDWLMEPSLAGAWTSGRLLGNYMEIVSAPSVGLTGFFHRSESAHQVGIGAIEDTSAQQYTRQ